MNDEIKEILTNCEKAINEASGYNDTTDKILDYITNLQQKTEQYENPDDMTLFYMWLDEKAKDKMKQLQEENERLKDLCDKYEEEHNTAFKLWKGKLKETMDETLIQKQHDRIKELEQINEEHRELNGNLRTANNTLCEVEEFMYNQAKDYKTRNEKAINCINHYATENDDYSKLYSTEEEELLEILQGSDE